MFVVSTRSLSASASDCAIFGSLAEKCLPGAHIAHIHAGQQSFVAGVFLEKCRLLITQDARVTTDFRQIAISCPSTLDALPKTGAYAYQPVQI
jgi:hypothetical protein